MFIQVIEGSSTTAFHDQQPVSTLVGHIDESPVASIHEQDVADLHGSAIVDVLDVVHEVAAGDENVPVAVVIEVDESRSPLGMRMSAAACPGAIGGIFKHPAT